MRTLRLISAALAIGALGALAPAALATTAGDGAAKQLSNGYDTATTTMGGWSNTWADAGRTIPIGAANRPFIKYLAITNPGTGTRVVINNTGNVPRPDALDPAGTTSGVISDVYALVSPTNACNTTQTASPGVCYDAPNRVTISLWRDTGGPSWTENFTGASTTPAVTANSEVHLIVGFSAVYSSLRWSWVNGVPSYWRNAVVPGVGGTVEVKFTPKTMPVMNSGGCSAIPVSTCDIQRADAERLMPQIILSMDDTLDAGLAGVLFGSTSAFIGSLESSPIGQGQAPTLTYGIAAPHENADGTDRVGTFYALIPSAILTLFGTGVEAFDQSILAVERTNGAGTFDIGWSAWNATANGTAGQFLTISNISFSAPKFEVKRRSSNTATGTASGSPPKSTDKRAAPRVKVRKTITLTRLAQSYGIAFAAGSTLSARVSTPKVCRVAKGAIRGVKAGTCRATLTVKPKKGKTTTQAVTVQIVK